MQKVYDLRRNDLKQGLSKYYWRVFMKIIVTCLKKQHDKYFAQFDLFILER